MSVHHDPTIIFDGERNDPPIPKKERPFRPIEEIVVAANSGAIGGGEIMQLTIGHALRDLGYEVLMVSPQHPTAFTQRAIDEGFSTVTINGDTRRKYMTNLRRWVRRESPELLWANGLIPSAATTGIPNRIVHLHLQTIGATARLAQVARFGALATVVASHFMTRYVVGSRVVQNWVDKITISHQPSETFRVGFLGNPTVAKGLVVLAKAIKVLAEEGSPVQLVLGGERPDPTQKDFAVVQEALDDLGDKMTQLGWVSPAAALSQMDVVAVPSVFPEPFGLVTVEGMSARVPVIASDSGGLPEVLGEDYPWLVPAGDIEAWATSLQQLRDSLPDRELLDRNEEHWLANYSPQAGRVRIKRLLDELRICPAGN